MTTKDDSSLLKFKQKLYKNHFLHSEEDRYSNFNLNKNQKCSPSIPLEFCSKSFYDSTAFENYEKREKLQAWKKPSKIISISNLNDEIRKEEFKKDWKKDATKNSSTLSLHIKVYENSNEVAFEFDSIKKQKNAKEDFIAFDFQNPFEFLRQQNDKGFEPDVSQFKASQRLLNPNKALTKSFENTPLAMKYIFLIFIGICCTSLIAAEGDPAPINASGTFIVGDPLAECRHDPASFTMLEILLMVVFQILLFLSYFGVITYIWMKKVRTKAQFYLDALPDRKIRAYMKREQKAPFELQPPPSSQS